MFFSRVKGEKWDMFYPKEDSETQSRERDKCEEQKKFGERENEEKRDRKRERE